MFYVCVYVCDYKGYSLFKFGNDDEDDNNINSENHIILYNNNKIVMIKIII